MDTIKKITVICLLAYLGTATAQEDTAFWNNKMLEIAHKGERKGWVNIKEEYLFSKDNFFSRNKEAFRLASNDSMRHISSTKKDELGYTRHLFQQTYKGIVIEGAQYKLHEKNERIFCANGYMVEGITCSTEPKISEATALKYALEHIGAKTYAWEIDYASLVEEDDEDLRLYYKETPAYQYPKGTLVLTRISDNVSMQAENFVLAYKFKILAMDPSSSNAIYVNAHTGEIVKNNSLENPTNNCNDGNALTRYNGWQTIVTKKRAGGNYILKDECRGAGIETRKYQGFGDTWVYYKDKDNIWEIESERPATSVHWAMGMTYDYFYDVHKRDGHYKSLPIISHIITESGAYYNNACWEPEELLFKFGIGDGIIRKPIVALDCVAHEYTHAVTHDAINLNYSNFETGALSESFSDIFGAVVEFYYLGNNGNYYQGDSIVIGGYGMLRDMTNPHHTDQPQTYGENAYWYSGSNHSTAVHTNCGVQNHWFYLLAEGDNTNNNSGYWVDGIGRDKAAEIVYRSITNGGLTSDFQYIDAAMSSVQAATELYGKCSYEAMQTYKAWQAVGVYFTPSNYYYDAPTTCALAVFLNILHPSASYIHISAMNQLDASCNLSSINKPVIFSAGNEVRLLPGFKSNQDFHAYICDQTPPNGGSPSHKSLGNNSTSYTDEDIDDAKELQKKDNPVIIYPNPNKGTFTINTNIDPQEIISVQVFSMIGQSVYKQSGLPNSTIQMPSSTGGMFYVEILTKTEKFVRKMVVF